MPRRSIYNSTKPTFSNGEQAQFQADRNGNLLVGNPQNEYETVAASQTAQVLGVTGGIGDFLAGVIVIPATTSPGVVTLLDGATSIPVFVGGATSVSDLKPFYLKVEAKSVVGAWKVTTGANVSVIGIGNFTV